MENVLAGVVIVAIILVVTVLRVLWSRNEWREFEAKAQKEWLEFEAETKEMFRDKDAPLHHHDDPYTGLVLRSNRTPRTVGGKQAKALLKQELLNAHHHNTEGGGGSSGNN